MKFSVIGGDRRAALLAELLHGEGHRVQSFALERAGLPKELKCADHPQGALYGADAVVLPLPLEKGGYLNAPYALQRCAVGTITEAVWPGQIVFGGLFTEEQRLWAINSGVQLVDWMRRPFFVLGNAALTAEGAVGLLLQEDDRSLAHSRVLIGGFGRIGKLLAPRLAALGAAVTVAARREESRAEAAVCGYEALDFEELPGRFDFVVNTVPARVFGESFLCCLGDNTLLLELASAPGGFDRNFAENLGLRVIAAPGLPGRCAPRAAAELMLEEVHRAMKEERE